MANVNVALIELVPQAGTDNDGNKIGRLPSTTKAAQNDTITITNANSIDGITDADLRLVADGVAEAYTLSGNVITLTSAATGSVRGTVIYKE